jgi:hypothetical protein
MLSRRPVELGAAALTVLKFLRGGPIHRVGTLLTGRCAMGTPARDHGDPGLLAFIGQLLADNSLDAAAAGAASQLLANGADSLSAAERILIEQEVIEPYLGPCEACHTTPDWDEVLHVYDTGLCTRCFDRLEGVVVPAVRPDWMPLPAPPPEEEDEPLIEAAVAEPTGTHRQLIG